VAVERHVALAELHDRAAHLHPQIAPVDRAEDRTVTQVELAGNVELRRPGHDGRHELRGLHAPADRVRARLERDRRVVPEDQVAEP